MELDSPGGETGRRGAAYLSGAGFARIGFWSIHEDGTSIVLTAEPPDLPGVYAFALDDGAIHYIGMTRTTLRRRMRHYHRRVSGQTMAKVRSVHRWVRERLGEGHRVEILAFGIERDVIEWRGLPVDVVAGLEMALIRQLRPTCNRPTRDRLES